MAVEIGVETEAMHGMAEVAEVVIGETLVMVAEAVDSEVTIAEEEIGVETMTASEVAEMEMVSEVAVEDSVEVQ